jgi:predicted HAD superfamily phosphohydrolase
MKVVIGGLLAIPIAYLLVFWIFKQDPLNVGPTIGNVVPFLVPAELRGDKVEDAGEDSKKVKPKAPAAKTVDDNLADLPIPDVDPDLVKPPQ